MVTTRNGAVSEMSAVYSILNSLQMQWNEWNLVAEEYDFINFDAPFLVWLFVAHLRYVLLAFNYDCGFTTVRYAVCLDDFMPRNTI